MSGSIIKMPTFVLRAQQMIIITASTSYRIGVHEAGVIIYFNPANHISNIANSVLAV